MGLMQRLSQFIFAEPRAQAAMLDVRASAGAAIVPWTAGKPAWLPREVRTYDTDAYRKIALIFRCVQYVADAAATAPLRAYAEKGGEQQELKDHPLRQLFQRPNPQMGEARFLSFVTMVASVSGFCLIEKERDRLGNVVALWPLRSDWARPIPRNQAAADWEYRIPGEQAARILSSEDVIPLTYADTPDRSPTGIGPLEVLLRETSVVNALTDFLKVFMDRGAMPLYIAIPSDDPQMAAQFKKQETKDAFMAAWRQRYGGLTNATEPMLSPGIKDIKPLGFDFNQLAYVDLNQLQEIRICEAFGVPPILVGTDVGLERSTFANYAEARRSFYEDTLSPLWARLDDAFTRHLLNDRDFRADISLQFDTSEIPALQDDVNEATTRAVQLFTSGIVSRTVAQRIAGQDPHGPDVFLQSFGLVEVPATNTLPTPKPTAAITDGADGQPSVDDTQDDEARARRALPEPRYVTRAGRTYLNERALSVEQRQAQARLVSHHRDQIIRFAALAEPALRRFFTGQRDRLVDAVLDDLRGHDGALLETRAIESFDWFAEDDALREALRDWWATVSAEAFADVSAELATDVPWSITNPYLADLFGVLGRRVTDINETTRRAIETVVRESLLEGTTMPDLADNLHDLFAETYRGRHLTVARTESQVAFNLSTQTAYQASGVVSRAQLHDNPEHTSDPGSDGLTCSERNGLVVPLAQVSRHVAAEHPNGTLAVSAVLDPAGGV